MIPQEAGGWQTLYNLSCRVEAQQAPCTGGWGVTHQESPITHPSDPTPISRKALRAVTCTQTHYGTLFSAGSLRLIGRREQRLPTLLHETRCCLPFLR